MTLLHKFEIHHKVFNGGYKPCDNETEADVKKAIRTVGNIITWGISAPLLGFAVCAFFMTGVASSPVVIIPAVLYLASVFIL